MDQEHSCSFTAPEQPVNSTPAVQPVVNSARALQPEKPTHTTQPVNSAEGIPSVNPTHTTQPVIIKSTEGAPSVNPIHTAQPVIINSTGREPSVNSIRTAQRIYSDERTPSCPTRMTQPVNSGEITSVNRTCIGEITSVNRTYTAQPDHSTQPVASVSTVQPISSVSAIQNDNSSATSVQPISSTRATELINSGLQAADTKKEKVPVAESISPLQTTESALAVQTGKPASATELPRISLAAQHSDSVPTMQKFESTPNLNPFEFNPNIQNIESVQSLMHTDRSQKDEPSENNRAALQVQPDVVVKSNESVPAADLSKRTPATNPTAPDRIVTNVESSVAKSVGSTGKTKSADSSTSGSSESASTTVTTPEEATPAKKPTKPLTVIKPAECAAAAGAALAMKPTELKPAKEAGSLPTVKLDNFTPKLEKGKSTAAVHPAESIAPTKAIKSTPVEEHDKFKRTGQLGKPAQTINCLKSTTGEMPEPPTAVTSTKSAHATKPVEPTSAVKPVQFVQEGKSAEARGALKSAMATATAALKAVKSATATAALKAVETAKSATTTAALKAVESAKSATATAALKAVESAKSATATAALKAVETAKSATATAALKAVETAKSATATAALKVVKSAVVVKSVEFFQTKRPFESKTAAQESSACLTAQQPPQPSSAAVHPPESTSMVLTAKAGPVVQPARSSLLLPPVADVSTEKLVQSVKVDIDQTPETAPSLSDITDASFFPVARLVSGAPDTQQEKTSIPHAPGPAPSAGPHATAGVTQPDFVGAEEQASSLSTSEEVQVQDKDDKKSSHVPCDSPHVPGELTKSELANIIAESNLDASNAEPMPVAVLLSEGHTKTKDLPASSAPTVVLAKVPSVTTTNSLNSMGSTCSSEPPDTSKHIDNKGEPKRPEMTPLGSLKGIGSREQNRCVRLDGKANAFAMASRFDRHGQMANAEPFINLLREAVDMYTETPQSMSVFVRKRLKHTAKISSQILERKVERSTLLCRSPGSEPRLLLAIFDGRKEDDDKLFIRARPTATITESIAVDQIFQVTDSSDETQSLSASALADVVALVSQKTEDDKMTSSEKTEASVVSEAPRSPNLAQLFPFVWFFLHVDPPRATFTIDGGESLHLIVNESEERIAVQVLSSNNEYFRVSPVYCFLDQGNMDELQVKRLKGGKPKRDKLVLNYTVASEESVEPRELFTIVAKVQTVIIVLDTFPKTKKVHRMRCT